MSSPGAAQTPIRIFEALRAYQISAALKAAIELGIFTQLGSERASAPELASRCGAADKGVRILCDTLVVEGFLEKADGKYANTAEGALFLDRNSPAYMGDAAQFLCTPELAVGMIQGLAETVRRGRTLMEGEGSVNPDNPFWVTFARVMGPLMMPAAQGIAGHVPANGPLQVLDIAAGHGLFGITIAQRNREARITAVDWAAVLEVARENATRAGVADRYTARVGSAFDVEFGEGYDIVLLTNFLHHFDRATNEKLLRKVHAALKPGGRAITLEFVPEEDRVSPAVPARFALTMLFSTASGDAYTFPELESMLRNAGFASSTHHRLPTDQSVIISTR